MTKTRADWEVREGKSRGDEETGTKRFQVCSVIGWKCDRGNILAVKYGRNWADTGVDTSK